MIWLELKVSIIIFTLILLPGWALLATNNSWRNFPVLIRWIAASALGVAFWPILFYGIRAIFPNVQIGPNKILFFLISAFIYLVCSIKRSWKQQFKFDRWETIGIIVFAITLFTRLYVAHTHSIPAWSDSLHHTLLTLLTAEGGRLPISLAPFESTPLNMYHLGLYALSGSTMMLSKAPAHTSLLWVAQVLNGLCGLGVYWVVDYFAGRRGAVFAALAVGLLSFQPAWFVNWGRFTQVASQFLILSAFMLIISSIHISQVKWPEEKWSVIFESFLAATVTAGVFLIHFRMAGLFLPLVLIYLISELPQTVTKKRGTSAIAGIFLMGILSIIFVLPALIPAFQSYIVLKSSPEVIAIETGSESSYYSWDWSYFTLIGSQLWIYILAALGLLLGLWRFRKFSLLMLIWSLVFILYAVVYKLGIPLLNIANFSGYLISVSLLLSIFLGIGFESLWIMLSEKWKGYLLVPSMGLIIILSIFAAQFRVTGIQEFRFFVQPADMEAMNWININLPKDAGFVINTFEWGDGYSHGTDAGYWIPYFTGRKTTAKTMLFSLGAKNELIYNQLLIKDSDRLETDPIAKTNLCNEGYLYAYLGKKGNFSRPGLSADKLLQDTESTLLYDEKGVKIIQLCSYP